MRLHSWLLSFVLLLLAIPYLTGCNHYGEVSDSTYQYAKSLYSICNTKDLDRLQILIEQLEQDQKVPANEQEWIREIFEIAEQDRWSEAAQRARQMMMDQVRI